MRTALAIALALVLPASAQAASVDVMVVGKDGVLRAPQEVRLKERTVKVGARRCRIAAATPLSALAATGVRYTLRDYARCTRRPRDAAGLYVRDVAGQRERGQAGWVYKVGRRIGTTSASDPSGPFGTGRRLRDGQRVTWFWCRVAGRCQRTLEVRPASASVAPGAQLSVEVRGFDDFGRGRRIAGATVRLAGAAGDHRRGRPRGPDRPGGRPPRPHGRARRPRSRLPEHGHRPVRNAALVLAASPRSRCCPGADSARASRPARSGSPSRPTSAPRSWARARASRPTRARP